MNVYGKEMILIKNSDGTYNIQAYKKDAQSSRDIAKYKNLTEKNLIEFIGNKDIVNQMKLIKTNKIASL